MQDLQPTIAESSPWLYLGDCWPWRVKLLVFQSKIHPTNLFCLCESYPCSCVFWVCLAIILRGIEGWIDSLHCIEEFQPKHASIWYQSHWLRRPENQESIIHLSLVLAFCLVRLSVIFVFRRRFLSFCFWKIKGTYLHF